MDTIIKAGSESKWKRNSMLIACNFNMKCNFKCSYCFNQNTRKNFNEQLSPKALHNLLSNLPLLKKDFYSFAIAGGEPSLYEYFPDMLKYINEFFSPENYTVFMATNGSLLHKLEDYLKEYPELNFHLAISMHLEQMDAETYLKKFSQFKFPNMCRIKLMLKPGTLAQANDIIEKAKSFGYTDFIIQPIIINSNVHPDYTDEEKLFFAHNPYPSNTALFNEYLNNGQTVKKDFTKEEFVLNPELVNYSGLQCLAGHSSMRVFADGSIAPCHFHKRAPDFNLNTHSLLEYIYIYIKQLHAHPHTAAVPVLLLFLSGILSSPQPRNILKANRNNLLF